MQKVLEQIILYSIATVCWPYRVHIDFRVGQLQCMHRPWSIVYKIEQFVLGSLLSFPILLNIRVCLLSYSKDLSYNITLQHHWLLQSFFLIPQNFAKLYKHTVNLSPQVLSIYLLQTFSFSLLKVFQLFPLESLTIWLLSFSSYIGTILLD